MTRANRITVQATENGYKATFYRTHKALAVVESKETEWKPDQKANSTQNRESYRAWLVEHADAYDVEWNPEKQTQAWERKYSVYMTDEQVQEDAVTLVSGALHRLADKSRYDMEICGIEVSGIEPVESTLSYVKNGRYEKNEAWCMADIEMSISAKVSGQDLEMVYHMAMKSGQICKPKTTIAEWNEMVAKEMELCGIEIQADTKEEKTA